MGTFFDKLVVCWNGSTVFHIHAVFLPSNIPHSRVVLYPSEHRVSALFVELAAGRPRPNHNNHSSLSLKSFPNWGFWQTEERTVTRHSLTTPTRSILTFLRVLSCQEIPHRAEMRFLRWTHCTPVTSSVDDAQSEQNLHLFQQARLLFCKIGECGVVLIQDPLPVFLLCLKFDGFFVSRYIMAIA